MKTAPTPKPVWFTSKGQIVIPKALREKYGIETGTRAVLEETADGILLKPVTLWSISKGFGLLKRRPGDKPFADEWADHKRAERELENK